MKEERLRTVFTSNSKAMRDIADLYLKPKQIIKDVTFGKGVFWKDIDTEKYDFKGTDLYTITEKLDFTELPFSENSVDVVVFDPPYRYAPIKGITAPGMEDRYKVQSSSPKNVQGVIKMYEDFISKTSYLKVGGIIIIKCQDTIQDGNQWWVHKYIMEFLEKNNFVLEDLAIYVGKSKNVRWKQQFHLDKIHSYFIIGRKK